MGMELTELYRQRISKARIVSYIAAKELIMALSARNQFKGTVVSVKGGSVMAEVVIDIGGGHHIVSLISTSSAKRLKLKKGSAAVAVIKATEVIVSTDLTSDSE